MVHSNATLPHTKKLAKVTARNANTAFITKNVHKREVAGMDEHVVPNWCTLEISIRTYQTKHVALAAMFLRSTPRDDPGVVS